MLHDDTEVSEAGSWKRVHHQGMCGCRWMERASKRMRISAWRLLLFGVRNSGAAFIKWGQWSATREDLFPQVSCFGCCPSEQSAFNAAILINLHPFAK